MTDEREEKAKLLLASNLEHAYVTGFITFQDIVARIKDIKDSLITGLMFLTKLHSEKIISAFYARWQGAKEDNVTIFLKALVGMRPFYEEMFKKINDDDIPKVFEELVESRIITWDNLVTAFPYRALMACLRKGLQRAEEAVPQEKNDATTSTDDTVEEEVQIEHQ